MVENWTERKNPNRLERRIEFDSFEQVREFLDRASEQSKKLAFYPDINFSRTHVSLTIHFDAGAEQANEAQLAFAQAANLYAPSNRVSINAA